MSKDKKDIFWKDKIYVGVPKGYEHLMFENYLYEFPSYPVQGSHQWKDGDEVINLLQYFIDAGGTARPIDNKHSSTAPQEVQGEKDGWIRVEDDLPEFDKEVQVFGQRKQSSPKMNGNPPVITITSRQDLRKTALEKYASRYQDKNQFRLMENVTHWQPLPSPPKAM